MLERLEAKAVSILTSRRLERMTRRYGGTQKCTWCRQCAQDGDGWSFKPFPDDFSLDVLTCGVCGGTSLWRWGMGMHFVSPLDPPTPAFQAVEVVPARSRDTVEAQQQAQAALDKVMQQRFSNFDAGAVIHWAERGLYHVKADPAPQLNAMSPHAFEPTAGDGCGVCGRGPNYTAHQPAGTQHVPCPCTLIEQDEDCPVGYPSMICGICEGKGHTTPEKVTALAREMIKIAGDMGEPEDPFAAWESIALIKSQHVQLRKALAIADQFITNGIELGYIRMPDPDSNDPASLTPGIVRAALASTEAP